ncbi:hypothetical protein [Micromonospora sp. NPDC004704]
MMRRIDWLLILGAAVTGALSVSLILAGFLTSGNAANVLIGLGISIAIGCALLVLQIVHIVGRDRPEPAGTPRMTEPAATEPGLPAGLYRWEQYADLEFGRLLERADRLTISARTAVNILSRNAVEIRRFLQRGGMMRVLVLDPSSAGLLKIYAEPSAELTDNLRTGLRYLADFGRQFRHQVQTRLTGRPPTYGLIWTDCLDKGGTLAAGSPSILQVKIYLEHSRTGGGRPNIVISSWDEPWHAVFVDDFNACWNEATPLPIPDEARTEHE